MQLSIIKVPGINAFGKTKGCRDSGNGIIGEMKNIWSSGNGKAIDAGRLEIEEIHVDNENLEEQERMIYENSLEEIEKNERLIFLGGDHSISYSIGRAFLEYCKRNAKEACLIVFDSHADCMKAGREPSHEEWLRGLIEKGFPSENILLIGARNNEIEEERFLREKKIKRISINQINNDIEGITDSITEFAGKRELYVSFDIDVVDPAFAPSTGYLEPGGLSSRQALYILSRLALVRNLRALDIVEIDSEKDKEKGNITLKLGARILGDFL